MKIYASVQSERATKGQGGNKYINISITDENKTQIAHFSVMPMASGGYNLSVVHEDGGYNKFIKGKKQKDDSHIESTGRKAWRESIGQ